MSKFGAPRRKPRIPTCGHPDRPHVAFGFCRECYDKQYSAAHYIPTGNPVGRPPKLRVDPTSHITRAFHYTVDLLPVELYDVQGEVTFADGSKAEYHHIFNTLRNARQEAAWMNRWPENKRGQVQILRGTLTWEPIEFEEFIPDQIPSATRNRK